MGWSKLIKCGRELLFGKERGWWGRHRVSYWRYAIDECSADLVLTSARVYITGVTLQETCRGGRRGVVSDICRILYINKTRIRTII